MNRRTFATAISALSASRVWGAIVMTEGRNQGFKDFRLLAAGDAEDNRMLDRPYRAPWKV